jgi:hypothetical protein
VVVVAVDVAESADAAGDPVVQHELARDHERRRARPSPADDDERSRAVVDDVGGVGQVVVEVAAVEEDVRLELARRSPR